MIVNALMISKGHRTDTRLHLVLESSSDFSRTLIFDGSTLGNLQGAHEGALLSACADALRASQKLGKDKVVTADNGIQVRTVSFEQLVKERLDGPVFMLDRKGVDIREQTLAEDVVFLLTDHVPMPKKAFNSLKRQGVMNLSLGPVVLHASQCISVIHNELDRR